MKFAANLENNFVKSVEGQDAILDLYQNLLENH